VEPKAKFRYSIENFRGLAIVFVMLSHVESLRQLRVFGELAYFTIVDATTWFVFISGYLFYYIEHKRFDYVSYLAKKAKYVILPYLVFSIPAIIAGLLAHRARLLDLSPLAYVVWSLIVGGAVVGPMWFIPMISLFFLVSWVFQRLADGKLIYPATLVGLAISIFSSRPINDMNPFLSFVHFVGFYLLGMSTAKSMRLIDRVNQSRASWVPIILGLSGFLAAAWFHNTNADSALGFFEELGKFNVFQFGKLCLLISVFFFFGRYINVPNRFLGYMAEISFGLFFIHGFFMIVFTKISQHIEIVDANVAFVIECLLVVVGSVTAVYAIKLLLGKRSRYVIGC
jgi:peptidoglycan/LPS O-acetylase OafA/YrhL